MNYRKTVINLTILISLLVTLSGCQKKRNSITYDPQEQARIIQIEKKRSKARTKLEKEKRERIREEKLAKKKKEKERLAKKRKDKEKKLKERQHNELIQSQESKQQADQNHSAQVNDKPKIPKQPSHSNNQGNNSRPNQKPKPKPKPKPEKPANNLGIYHTADGFWTNNVKADAALSMVGRPSRCTEVAEAALNAVGKTGWVSETIEDGSMEATFTSLTTETVMAAGKRVSSMQVGDLLYYDNGGAGSSHVAVYIGNNMAVHGGWTGNTTVVAPVNIGSGVSYISRP